MAKYYVPTGRIDDLVAELGGDFPRELETCVVDGAGAWWSVRVPSGRGELDEIVSRYAERRPDDLSNWRVGEVW